MEEQGPTGLLMGTIGGEEVTIFMAGSFNARERLRPIRERLRSMGYTVRSRWLDETTECWGNPPACIAQVTRDLEDINGSDVIILDTIDVTTFGNSYTEWGAGLGRMMRKYLVGPPRNHYHYLAMQRFPTWDECFQFLQGE